MIGIIAVFAVFVFEPSVAVQAPPNGEILYYEETSRGKGNLVVLDLATGDKRQVGRSGSRSDHFPSWSPDGQRMVFESYREGGWHVWIADADGNNGKRLSNLPAYDTRSYEFDPAFAPDNQTVAFVSDDRLWTVTLNDRTPQRLTRVNHGIFETAPAYSPRGDRIAIAGRDDRTRAWNVYTLSRDGGDLRRLTRDGQSLAPEWSPDGSRILFYSYQDGSLELYEMTKQGREIAPVLDRAQRASAGFRDTAFVDPWDGNWGATEQYRASYSPDGEWIVFSRDLDGDRELFVCRRDGSGLRRITQREGLDGQPDWRKNGQR